ncbi:MAG: putative FAD-dependent dehydrogenase [Saprospiraceae bacterium]|jgi:uncharacterized FAD-dependent dehydrogenase
MIKEINIRVSPEVNSNNELLRKEVCKQAGFIDTPGFTFRVRKRSIDARSKHPVYQLRVEIAHKEKLADTNTFGTEIKPVDTSRSCIIIGAGPAGLFAALELIEQGVKPVIIERGKNVKDRRRDLAAINKEHIVNPESNYCFGEGGAGTYSDGKLYTRSNKRGDVDKVLQQLVAFGANENILVDAHPHIGTNKLPEIITSIRNYILESGGEVLFNSKLTDIILKGNKIKTIVINEEKEIEVQNLILATGHSARDVFEILHKKNILIENKPFAIGVRVEHPQLVVDQAQYNAPVRSEYLPPASYGLVAQTGKKAVYSFCMCPGGIIAPCATSPGEIVTNGWSPSKRNNPYANSGIVVPVDELDWDIYKNFGPLAAMKFQSAIEQKAFELGGKTQTAPAQRLKDFVEGKTSSDLPKTSYQPGITSVDMCEVLPEKFHVALRLGFKDFGKKMRNYLSNEAVIHGVESRTSSPVRIPRSKINLQHPEIINFYPCGEGAGYAGGIMSAAIDGQKCALAIAQK